MFHDGERLDRPELQRRAGELELAPPLRRLVDMLPDGDYDRDGAGAELARIQQQEGMWRDESRLPAADLHAAVATSGTEGQFDDPTGNEAGPAQAFSADSATGGGRPGPAESDTEPDPDSVEGRRLRPSWEGPRGPH